MSVIETTLDAVPGWSRMPKEPQPAIEAAREYLKMGASRSLASVASTLGKNVSLLERWSKQWSWVGRATEYDDYLARQERVEFDKQASAQREERRRRADEQDEAMHLLKMKLITKIGKMLDFPLVSVTQADGKTTLNPARWSLKDVAPLLDIVLKIDKATARQDGEEGDLTPEEFVYNDHK